MSNMRKEKTYMDDRTSVAKDPEALIKGVKAWMRFSNYAYLIENNAKLQLTARTEGERERLHDEATKHGLEGYIKETIEAPGATTASGRGRKLVPKEEDRLKKAWETAILLKGIGGPKVTKLSRH